MHIQKLKIKKLVQDSDYIKKKSFSLYFRIPKININLEIIKKLKKVIFIIVFSLKRNFKLNSIKNNDLTFPMYLFDYNGYFKNKCKIN